MSFFDSENVRFGTAKYDDMLLSRAADLLRNWPSHKNARSESGVGAWLRKWWVGRDAVPSPSHTEEEVALITPFFTSGTVLPSLPTVRKGFRIEGLPLVEESDEQTKAFVAFVEDDDESRTDKAMNHDEPAFWISVWLRENAVWLCYEVTRAYRYRDEGEFCPVCLDQVLYEDEVCWMCNGLHE